MADGVDFDIDYRLTGLLNFAKVIDRRLPRIMLRGARRIQITARENAPYKTGFMHDHILVERDPSTGPAEEMIRIYGGAEYTIYQERRKHFMHTGYEENKQLVVRDAQREVFECVNEVNR